jgi:ribose transport system permease protein
LILVAGVCFGFILGLITAYGRIPAFITTLAALIAFADWRSPSTTDRRSSPSIRRLSQSSTALSGYPAAVLLSGVLLRLAAFVMNYTKLGREIYAVGGNPGAAVLTGINVKKVQTTHL